MVRNATGAEDKRVFYRSIRTDGHFVDVIYTRPPDGETVKSSC